MEPSDLTFERVQRYDRWTRLFLPETGIDRVEFRGPSGGLTVRPTFVHQPADLVYDHHGYEEIVPKGGTRIAVRFTPSELGRYQWAAFRNQGTVEEGEFICEPSGHPGFVKISPRDPRYFECTNGESFCVMGINLCLPPKYPLSAGSEFQTSDEFGTLGMLDYKRWFREFSENGGNFVRLWLSSDYFDPESDVAGQLELKKFARLDEVVKLARIHNVRLKFCLEHFRSLGPKHSGWSVKFLKHPVDGTSPGSMDDWFTSGEWQSFWWNKVEAYIARYGDDPTVMAWELWNEINACQTSEWSILRDWTAKVAKRLQPLVPKQLVVNSLGSFDKEEWRSVYDDFHMDELAFQQVHRYLDQGAELSVCHDAFRLGVEAVRDARRPDKPVLLAETGAVNDNHTGPFRWYRADHRGILFHDTVYPALFAGAAGPGQIWHWEEYVDKNDLWRMFRPLRQLLSGIDLPAEAFVPFEKLQEDVHILGLAGRRNILGLVRSKEDWRHLFLNDQAPQRLERVVVDFSEITKKVTAVEFISPWRESQAEAPSVSFLPDSNKASIALPPFEISCLFKMHVD